MIINSFEQIIDAAKNISHKPRLIIPCPYDANNINAINAVVKDGLCNVTVVGESAKMKELLPGEKNGCQDIEIIEKGDEISAIEEAYKLLMSGYAQIIMKGLVQTKNFMKVLISDKSFINSQLLTHVCVFQVPNLNKLIFVTDSSILVEPNVQQKYVIIKNALNLTRIIGIEHSKVAVLSSTEKIDMKIKSSVEAQEVTRLFEDEENFSADVYGPIALDNAVSSEAADIKQADSKVAGNADILVVPNLDAGNILTKGLTYLAEFDCAGIVMGAQKPIVLTSRSASAKERYNSISIACLMAEKCI